MAGRREMASGGELRLEDLVDNLGIAFAAHRLHHLPDKKAEELVAARAIFGDLVRLRCEHLVAGGGDRALIRDLHQAQFADGCGGA
jgi:hypothetical protein